MLALYDPNSQGPELLRLSHFRPEAGAQGILGLSLCCLGLPDQGLGRSKAAVAVARKLNHSQSAAAALQWGVPLISLIGEDAALGEWAGEMVAVAAEIGFPLYLALGAIYQGWAKVKNNDVAKGISSLRSGLDAYRATGTRLLMPHHVALLAQAYEIAGQIDEAQAQLDEALQIVEQTGERWFKAELHRL
jgi:predicted ATPase